MTARRGIVPVLLTVCAVLSAPLAFGARGPIVANFAGDIGADSILVETPRDDDVSAVPQVSFDAVRNGVLNGYRLGHWPHERSSRPPEGYEPPRTFYEVTPETRNVRLSPRFVLGQFLTKDQPGVWPKYVAVQPRLIEKLEAIADELKRLGMPSEIRIMSGFRTPRYNGLDVRPGGRARDSRHMYGDAADVYVDANGDGVMDDLDGDGRIGIGDSKTLLAIAERVEEDEPQLVGGLSAYPTTATHGPFVHVDARGYRARW
jgi:Bacterial protein of unknown function (DUF882)